MGGKFRAHNSTGLSDTMGASEGVAASGDIYHIKAQSGGFPHHTKGNANECFCTIYILQ